MHEIECVQNERKQIYNIIYYKLFIIIQAHTYTRHLLYSTKYTMRFLGVPALNRPLNQPRPRHLWFVYIHWTALGSLRVGETFRIGISSGDRLKFDTK